ncbi:MAG TPA: hypothetical protein PLE74_01065 [Candidatus Cloacimonadota bacterium]|nr:hypothetical protein [Candidatus Cloacimonadota bacterium]
MHDKTKQELAEMILKSFQDRVKPSLIDAEIGDFEVRPSTVARKEKLVDAIEWLDSFILMEVREFNEVYALCPPDRWKHYKVYKLTDLPEMKLLKEAKSKLKTKWTSRPTCIRRTYGSN